MEVAPKKMIKEAVELLLEAADEKDRCGAKGLSAIRERNTFT